MADQQFCLRWNNHQSTLISVFDTLLLNGTLVDCTLAAEGQYLKAHKVVLSACSPYLESLLSQHFEKHPIVILKDVKFSELKSMMDYMYRGEVNISQDQLGTFLKAAESLQIKGLSDNGADGDARDVGSTPKAPPPRKANVPAPSNRPEPVRPDSPLTDGSMSPSSRKRRRVRRSSQDDDNHLESNSCDLPSQAQSTPVPNIPASSSITTTPIVKPAIVKPEQTDVNRIDSNSLPLEVLKKEIEPISEPLIEPKTEYLEDVNNEDSVEDLTLDDDDDMEGMDISNMSNMSNMSRPGPSHGNDISNQSFTAWNLGANQSGTDEVFMAAQEAVNQHRDSQGTLTEGRLVETVFVFASSGQSSDKFFSELTSPLAEPNLGTEKSSIVCLGRETEELNKAHIKSQNKQTTIFKQKKSKTVKINRLGSTKKLSVKDRVQRSQNNKTLVRSSNKCENQSIFGRKRKKLEWSGDSFDIKVEPCGNEADKNPWSNEEKPCTSRNRTDSENKDLDKANNSQVKKKPKHKYLYAPFLDKTTYNQKQLTKKKSYDTSSKNKHHCEISSKFGSGYGAKSNKSSSVHKKGDYICNECGLRYKYVRGLRHHQKHSCGIAPQLECAFCNEKFRYKRTLKDHQHSCHQAEMASLLDITE